MCHLMCNSIVMWKCVRSDFWDVEKLQKLKIQIYESRILDNILEGESRMPKLPLESPFPFYHEWVFTLSWFYTFAIYKKLP